MTLLLIGLFIFIGAHLSLRAVNLRTSIETKIGKMPFKGLFSLVSLAGLIFIIAGFSQFRPIAPEIYTPPFWGKYINYIFTYISVVLFLTSYLGGKIKAKIVHAQLAAVKFWALGHLLANGDLASVILFVGFLIWAIIARVLIGKVERQIVAWGRGDEGSIAFGILIWCTIAFKLHVVLFGVQIFGGMAHGAS